MAKNQNNAVEQALNAAQANAEDQQDAEQLEELSSQLNSSAQNANEQSDNNQDA
ncbi:hypothetical protein [Paenibacillus eucommiae]|uniref:FlaG/YvyC family protein n=1 Tax=Paenibacillus eucommiae TaxID=1355755 RepID=A0ABS4JB42_9BACL|nr:hypothetical protein [Paenibacillus eucommiae]MBP1997071.1 putative FlaG/YvyC family protein [Paenibacillus eucommiae]